MKDFKNIQLRESDVVKSEVGSNDGHIALPALGLARALIE